MAKKNIIFQNGEVPTEERNRKALNSASYIYVSALALIGILTVSMYLASDRVVKGIYNTAGIVNLTGKQRMISQRIALLAVDISRTDNIIQHAELEATLKSIIKEMRDNHSLYVKSEFLSSENNNLSDNNMNIAEDSKLNMIINEYLLNAEAVANLSLHERMSSKQLKLLLDESRYRLLPELDAVVTKVQKSSESTVNRLRNLMLIATVVILAVLVFEATYIFKPLFYRIKKAQNELLEAATTDPLTGSLNRRQLMESAKLEFIRSKRYRQQAAIIMLDIDKFKHINDTYGHSVGDEAITSVAQTITSVIRSNDIFGRLGGDEFALVLPQSGKDAGLLVANKILAAVSSVNLEANGEEFNITMSIGVTVVDDTDVTVIDSLDRADKALYCSKSGGRNRVSYLDVGSARKEDVC